MGRSVGLKPKGRGTKGGNLDLPPFLVLCSLWPGNADVLQLVWYQQETEVNPEQHIATLGLLNLGKFATPEADAFRISNLTVPWEDNSIAYIAVGSAAKGLTMNRPIDALSPLLAAGQNILWHEKKCGWLSRPMMMSNWRRLPGISGYC